MNVLLKTFLILALWFVMGSHAAADWTRLPPPNVVDDGQWLILPVVITNATSVDLPERTLDVLFSTDHELDLLHDAVIEPDVRVPALAAGDTVTLQLPIHLGTLPIPWGFQGRYYALAVFPDNGGAEITASSTRITIRPRGETNPDLAVEIVSVSPSSARSTDEIEVNVRWRNDGTEDISNVSGSLWMMSGADKVCIDFVEAVTLSSLPYGTVRDVSYKVRPLRKGGVYAWLATSTSVIENEIQPKNNFAKTDYSYIVTSNLKPVWEKQHGEERDGRFEVDSAMSSPAWIDINGDKVLDVVFGTGVENVYGRVVAVNGATGDTLWTVDVGNEVVGSPAVGVVGNEARIFIGGRGGEILALNKSGRVLWRNSMPWSQHEGIPETVLVVHTPVLADIDGDGHFEVIVTAGGGVPERLLGTGVLAIYRATDGEELFFLQETDTEYWASPAVADLNADGFLDVVLGSGGECQFAIEPETGKAPCIKVAGKPGFVAAFDGKQLLLGKPTQLWSVATHKRGIESSPVVMRLPDGNGNTMNAVIVGAMDGYIAAYNGATGAEIWRNNDFSPPSYEDEGELVNYYEFYSSPAVGDVLGDGRLEIAISGGKGLFPSYSKAILVVLDAETGETKWTYKYGMGFSSSPVIADLTGDGKGEVILNMEGLCVFDAPYEQTFTKLFVMNSNGIPIDVSEFPMLGPATPAVVDLDHDGSLNIVALAWAMTGNWLNLEATLSAPNREPAKPFWPKFRGNLRNTGTVGD